jgi:CheY-like chemotaxis protein
MDPDTKARIFEPFFTTKLAGKGTGLGLATVYGIVKQSNGFIWVESEIGRGTSFEIYLPACSRNEEKAAEQLPAPILGGGKETILLVEDETGVRELACIYLQAAGYTVLLAEDGESALKIAANRMNQIHLVLTDMIMPKMNGNRLADELKKIRPELKVLYMTGYAEFPSSQLEQHFGGANLLQKPFSRAALLRKVIETLPRNETDPVPKGRA